MPSPRTACDISRTHSGCRVLGHRKPQRIHRRLCRSRGHESAPVPAAAGGRWRHHRGRNQILAAGAGCARHGRCCIVPSVLPGWPCNPRRALSCISSSSLASSMANDSIPPPARRANPASSCALMPRLPSHEGHRLRRWVSCRPCHPGQSLALECLQLRQRVGQQVEGAHSLPELHRVAGGSLRRERGARFHALGVARVTSSCNCSGGAWLGQPRPATSSRAGAPLRQCATT